MQGFKLRWTSRSPKDYAVGGVSKPKVLVLVAQLAVMVVPGNATALTFRGLGELSGGVYFSEAQDISGDGGFVVGTSIGQFGLTAFRWSEQSGIMMPLGDLHGGAVGSRAFAASYDGSVIVGDSASAMSAQSGSWPYVAEAFRWTLSGGMEALGDIPEGAFNSTAFAVSADGSRVGLSSVAFGVGDRRGGIWTSSEIVVTASNYINGLSGDGTIGVGQGYSGRGSEAVRWTAGTGTQHLAWLVDGGFHHPTAAYSISVDGTTIVGAHRRASRDEPFRWASDIGVVGLGYLPGDDGSDTYGRALDVSGDGNVIVGEMTSSIDGEKHAFVWTPQSGMMSVQKILEAAGVDSSGWMLREATAVSDDGRVIVGWGTNAGGNTEGWIATLDVISEHCAGDANRDRIVDGADLATVTMNYGRKIGATWPDGDFTGDGKIGLTDLMELRLNWGQACATTPDVVPEPNSILAVALGLIFLWIVHRGRAVGRENPLGTSAVPSNRSI